jgi:hypothetical protein
MRGVALMHYGLLLRRRLGSGSARFSRMPLLDLRWIFGRDGGGACGIVGRGPHRRFFSRRRGHRRMRRQIFERRLDGILV